jgi:hypothetical protein
LNLQAGCINFGVVFLIGILVLGRRLFATPLYLKNSMETFMETTDLLKLYELYIKEEHDFLEAHQTRIKYYSTIISALFVALIAGILKASQWYHVMILLIGPVLIFVIAKIAKEGTFRLYQRFLEAITMRAKVERDLGLASPNLSPVNESTTYWEDEPIISPRHLDSRLKITKSDKFIEEHKKKGYHKWTLYLFNTFQIFSFLLLLMLICLLILIAFDVINLVEV